jgi:hypothetical protein
MEYGGDDSIDVDAKGFGVMLDTNLSGQNVFNYRLSIGYNELDISYGNDFYSVDLDGHRITIDNTFGFGIVKAENIRLWIGPQVHLDFSSWDETIGGTYLEKDNVNVIGYGVGVVTGANFHIPRVGSICPELGIRLQGNVTDTYEERYSYYDGWVWRHDENEIDYSYNETVVFFKLSFLFGQ